MPSIYSSSLRNRQRSLSGSGELTGLRKAVRVNLRALFRGRVLQVRCPLNVRTIQWMGGIRRTDGNDRVIGYEDVSAQPEMSERGLHRFGIEGAGLEAHIVLDDQCVGLPLEAVFEGEGSAVLCSEELQCLQDAVKVELLKVECDDSGDLVLSPPFPHLFGMIVGEIVEKFLYRAGRCCDRSEFLCVSFPIYIASKCLVSDYVHADPFVSGYFAELLVDILVYAECSCCALVRRSDCSSRPGLFQRR